MWQKQRQEERDGEQRRKASGAPRTTSAPSITPLRGGRRTPRVFFLESSEMSVDSVLLAVRVVTSDRKAGSVAEMQNGQSSESTVGWWYGLHSAKDGRGVASDADELKKRQEERSSRNNRGAELPAGEVEDERIGCSAFKAVSR